MFITRISIHKEGHGAYSYGKKDPAAPYRATIEVEGRSGKVELNLTEELSKRVVAVIADEVAAAGRATAEAMVAEAMTITALPAPVGAA